MVMNVPHMNVLYQQVHNYDYSVNCTYMRPHTFFFNYLHDGSEKKTLKMVD